MKGKKKSGTKPNIICVRLTDGEMDEVRDLITRTNKRPSEFMREAFLLLANSQPRTGKGGNHRVSARQ